MCNILFKNLLSEDIMISQLESTLPSPNYTVDTLRVIQKEYPSLKVALMVGRDQFESFHLWKDPHEILKTVSLVVVNRETLRKENKQEKTLKDLTNHIANKLNFTITFDTQNRAKIKETKTHIYLIDKTMSPAESTTIREMVISGKKLPKGQLTLAKKLLD